MTPNVRHRLVTAVLVLAAFVFAGMLVVGAQMMTAPVEQPPHAPRLVTGGPEPTPGITSGTLVLPAQPSP